MSVTMRVMHWALAVLSLSAETQFAEAAAPQLSPRQQIRLREHGGVRNVAIIGKDAYLNDPCSIAYRSILHRVHKNSRSISVQCGSLHINI